MMISNGSNNGRKKMSFDLNLVPFIDVLSTCICFLLITAVFINLGTVNVKQAMGDGQSLSKEKDPASMMIRLSDDGTIGFTLKNVKNDRGHETIVRAANEGINWSQTDSILLRIRTKHPEIQTALLLPSQHSKYEDLIRFMDQLKKGSIANVGIAPL